MNFNIQKFQKLYWLKNASENGGAMKMVIDSVKPNNIILNSVTKKLGRLWTDTTPENLLQLTTKDNGIYEVLETDYGLQPITDIKTYKLQTNIVGSNSCPVFS